MTRDPACAPGPGSSAAARSPLRPACPWGLSASVSEHALNLASFLRVLSPDDGKRCSTAFSPGRPARGSAGASGHPLWALAPACCWPAAREAGVGRDTHTPLETRVWAVGLGCSERLHSLIEPRVRPALPPESLGRCWWFAPAKSSPVLPSWATGRLSQLPGPQVGARSPLVSPHLHPELPHAGLQLAASSMSHPKVMVPSGVLPTLSICAHGPSC